MSKKSKIVVSCLLSLGVLLAGWWLLSGHTIAILDPRGAIADEMYGLIIFTSLLSLVVVIPVYWLTAHIAWTYRRRNKKARYDPSFHDSKLLEAIWWLIPLVLVIILAVVAYATSHALDPYRPLKSDKKPVSVQVIALNWKWLFIYPEEDIATVNYLRIPVDRPVNFKITADAPMNSFWIPQLGGQIYAMAGMESRLHLLADKPGEYKGASANLSGEGFAGMNFVAEATSESDYRRWVKEVKRTPNALTEEMYRQLAQPSKDNPRAFYSSRDPEIYGTVIMKYMMPGHGANPEDKDHDAAHDRANTRHDAGSDHH